MYLNCNVDFHNNFILNGCPAVVINKLKERISHCSWTWWCFSRSTKHFIEFTTVLAVKSSPLPFMVWCIEKEEGGMPISLVVAFTGGEVEGYFLHQMQIKS